VTISTDDPTISAVRLSDEFITCLEVLGVSPAELWGINTRALDAAFAEPEVIDGLRRDFNSWAARIPELSDPARPMLHVEGDRL